LLKKRYRKTEKDKLFEKKLNKKHKFKILSYLPNMTFEVYLPLN